MHDYTTVPECDRLLAKDTPPRFCRDCAHFLPEYKPSPNVTVFHACGRTGTDDLVTALRQYSFARDERRSGQCGAEGRYFEPWAAKELPEDAAAEPAKPRTVQVLVYGKLVNAVLDEPSTSE